MAFLAISSSVAFADEKLTLGDDAELIAALAARTNDGPTQVDATLESLAKAAQIPSESPEATSDCACDKNTKSAETKATESKPVAAKAAKSGSKSDKKLETSEKKSGKKFKTIVPAVPVAKSSVDSEIAGSDVSEKKEKAITTETNLDAPEKEAEEDEETGAVAAKSQGESEKATKLKESKKDSGKEKENSKKSKTDKKRSKRDAKSKSKGKKTIKSKGSKKNKGNNKK